VIGWDAAEFYSPQERLKENWNKNPLLKAIPAARAERVLFVDYQLWGSMTRGPITDQLILQRLPELLSPLLPG
jgi:ABC-type Fe3+-hydroxamate transport system substrate-binding protein